MATDGGKRKAYILPHFTDFRKDALAELASELGISVAGLRKDQLIDYLYEADNAATFGYPSQWSTFDCEHLLTTCLKARVRYFRQVKSIKGVDPSFAGLSNDLNFLGNSGSSSCATCPSVTINVAVNSN